MSAPLNKAQRDVVAHYLELTSELTTVFVGPERDSGRVEVLILGDGWVWSLLIAESGDHSTSEADVGDFSTGITT